jgi:predicted ArsR family transcriptional regulator
MNINQEILTALKTYQWTPSATVYNFARHLHYSEGYIKRQLEGLVQSGDIDKIVEGKAHSRPRLIYRLKK